MIDEDRRECLEMQAERVERIRAHVPSEHFDLTTAQVIARVEVETGLEFFDVKEVE